jgi:ABC-type oligopeptide transport system substrate-binding subunit
LPALAAAPPHLLWDVPTDELATLRKLGYADVRTLVAPRVCFLAVNQRRDALASDALRRALAHAIDRQALLDRHFRGGPMTGDAPPHHTANGPFPYDSWAAAPPGRVPRSLHEPERVLALLKPFKKDLDLTLKYPDDDPRVGRACTELAQQLERRFADGSVKLSLRPQPLPPQELRRALEQRDYDLLYHSLDHGDNPIRLWSLFDPAGLAPGGSNYLGCTDAQLQSRLLSALQHRAFPLVREHMHNIHAHLIETMPLIPLWQLNIHVAIHTSLRVPAPDPLALFGDILDWRLMP